MELAEVLKGKNLKIATAESCTGGLLADMITDVPGASEYYLGGVIAYSNHAKINVLGVRKETIEKFGAVSEKCSLEMAEGVAKLLGGDIGVATTGVAGPTEMEGKPVGTVYIGIYLQGNSRAKRYMFHGGRREIKEKAARKAIEFLITEIKI